MVVVNLTPEYYHGTTAKDHHQVLYKATLMAVNLTPEYYHGTTAEDHHLASNSFALPYKECWLHSHQYTQVYRCLKTY
jgi:hypothetical protein